MDRKGRRILATNLKALRDLHAMTQEDLAGAAQIDRSYISMIEHRKYAASIDMIEKIAAAFQLGIRSEEHTSELQSLMRISYAVFCLKKKNKITKRRKSTRHK